MTGGLPAMAVVAVLCSALVHASWNVILARARPGVVGLGLGIYLAYGLTLVALSLVSVALVPAVAALRETSILFVLGLSWLVGRRAAGGDFGAHARPRPTVTTAAGAVLILGGVSVLALG